jgi:hypothetical protein
MTCYDVVTSYRIPALRLVERVMSKDRGGDGEGAEFLAGARGVGEDRCWMTNRCVSRTVTSRVTSFSNDGPDLGASGSF